MNDNTNIKLLKAQAQAELNRLEADSSAKEVAGKAIGKQGLFYITFIVVIGVLASLALEESKIAAVMGLLGAALTALISMLNGIAGANPKQEKPEFEVIKNLIEKLDRANEKEPMRVDVAGDKVTVTKGEDSITTSKGA
jgi:ABC-type proline/glycine betaine transport system ATPase subunit